MNGIEQVSPATALLARYADVRARLYGPRPVVRRIRPPAPVVALPIYVDPIDETIPADCPLNMLLSPSWRFLAAYAAVKHGVDKDALIGPLRKPDLVRARHEAIHLCHTHIEGVGLTKLGAYFNRDHTTILSSLRKHAERMGAVQ